MSYYSIHVDYTETLDSPAHLVELEYSLTCRYRPGERRVMYERDGSGYPGSPPEVEVVGAVCYAVTVDEGDRRVPSNRMAIALGRGLLSRIPHECVAAEVHRDVCDRAFRAGLPAEV